MCASSLCIYCIEKGMENRDGSEDTLYEDESIRSDGIAIHLSLTGLFY